MRFAKNIVTVSRRKPESRVRPAAGDSLWRLPAFSDVHRIDTVIPLGIIAACP